MHKLTLFLPALLAFARQYALLSVQERQNFPALCCLLARADRETGLQLRLLPQLYELLSGKTGVEGEHLPWAQWSYLSDKKEKLLQYPERPYLYRADPVFLQCDRDQLLLTSGNCLQLPHDHSVNLVKEINRFFAQDCWHIEALTPERWYLFSDHALPGKEYPPINTQMLQSAPLGGENTHWQTSMTELQMLLHSSSVNQQRVQQGLLPINGIWLWGQGNDVGDLSCSHNQFYSRDTLANSLAMATQTPASALPKDFTDWYRHSEGETDALLYYPDLHLALQQEDIFSWLTLLEELEAKWFAPILQSLAKKQLKELSLFTLSGYNYRISTRTVRRFWRRKKVFGSFLSNQQILL